VIFRSLRDYLVAEHGRAAAAAVFATEPEYLISTAYPDEDLRRLVDVAATHTRRDADEILFGLGVFTGETTFPRLYPAFFAAAPSACEFLLEVEVRIHELVRETIPGAAPPHLAIAPLGEEGVSITYDSPRRLCVFLRGVAEGTASYYGQHADLDEPTCMLRGDEACRVDVRLSDGRLL
jgi:hypothetical protein